jgi:hypothetical protein
MQMPPLVLDAYPQEARTLPEQLQLPGRVRVMRCAQYLGYGQKQIPIFT